MAERVYLDWNATAPLRREARDAVIAELGAWANPSSIYSEGRGAKGRLEGYRDTVLTSLGALGAQLVFTSGGTEALALALRGTDCERVLVSAIEHSAVLEAAPHAERLPVEESGRLQLDALKAALASGPALVAVMHANNETGVLQPVEDVIELVRAAGGRTLVDAVQTAGKYSLPAADYVALSAHKIGGPPGAGALLVRCAEDLLAVQKGGGQEQGLRGGTENLPAIAGFAAALDVAEGGWLADAARRQALLEERLGAAGGEIIGAGAERIATTTMVRLPGMSASSQLMGLDLAGFAVSSGAACSSGKVGSSHVLAAMGHSTEAAGEAIRISTGWATTDQEVDAFAEAWTTLARRRRAA
ncbi:cysteine desulfurase [Pacificimonas flava]|uniref:Cysteine desulfurase n=2 Tax=Pacificimonas TaxID=1960290 RepID=A0A219B6X9_9SPHN|nr:MULTISPECIES: cysteine desulfurase family protein [Pacificimonas]MBZ6378701.1 cysteine desulfurase [Pacificimonas aurantium]OWV34031.1 cysteine desulfurase [Pacificimonas flava]